MSKNDVSELQFWLKQKGAGITVDGQGGPQTRQAIVDIFRHKDAPAITSEGKRALAASLGGTLRQMKATASVESRGSGWDKSGLPIALYERHKAYRVLGAIRARFVPGWLGLRRAGGYTNDADKDGLNDSWEKVVEAACIVGIKAFEFASWGKFQIMGFNAKKLGYENAAEMVWELSRSEAAHYDSFARFIRAKGMKRAFSSISSSPNDCRAFARKYNGLAYAKHNYHGRLAQAYRRKK